MADYAEEIADAIEMLNEFGGEFTIEREQETIPDTEKPWRGAEDAPLAFTTTAVMLEFKKSQQSQGFTAGSEDTAFVLPSDMVVYIAAGDERVTFEPTARDIVVTPNGRGRYGVVDNLILAPNGVAILYKLWIRR